MSSVRFKVEDWTKSYNTRLPVFEKPLERLLTKALSSHFLTDFDDLFMIDAKVLHFNIPYRFKVSNEQSSPEIVSFLGLFLVFQEGSPHFHLLCL